MNVDLTKIISETETTFSLVRYMLRPVPSNSITPNYPFTVWMNVTDIDECASSPCADGETCVDGVDGYKCDMGHHDCQGGTVDYNVKGPIQEYQHSLPLPKSGASLY